MKSATEPKGDPNDAESAPLSFPAAQKLIYCLLLALATIALYNPVTRAPFLNLDDVIYVTQNAQVRSGLSWHTVGWAFQTTEASNWHPVTWLSHALDCQIFGLDPAGPHFVNVLLHAANSVVLFLILLSATGWGWRSLMVAALFAVHPLQVESVAWIAERKNVLSMLFFLLALTAYGWYARRPGVGRYFAVTLAYALGLMTKPQVITFPFALLLLDYWPLGRMLDSSGPQGDAERVTARRSFWMLVAEKMPWIAMSVASAIITMKVQTDATQVRLPFWAHVGNAALAYVTYLGKAFWPAHLAPVYPHPELSIGILAAALSALALVGLTIPAVILRRRYPPLLVGWLWFVGTLVPMIGLVQVGVQSMADRYAYVPLLGIFLIVTWGVADLAQAWRIPNAVLAVGAAAILAALGFVLHRQVGFWSDNVTLWTHTLQVTKDNFMAEDSLATALIAAGRMEEAVPHLERARFLRPDDPSANLNLASYQQLRGNDSAAIDGYTRVLQFTRNPYWVGMARVNRGYARYSLRQYAGAQVDFEEALHLEPTNAAAYRGLGLLAQNSGDIEQAIADYTRSAQLEASSINYLLLAQALELGGRASAAHAAEFEAGRRTRDLEADKALVMQLLRTN